MSRNTLFQRWFLPGFVFQSVLIGGGYATGRELVEFFLGAGPLAGLVGLLVATSVFSVSAMICFELARLTHTYDYRTFLKQLIGPGWIVYELLLAALILLVLAVLGAASGELVSSNFGWPPAVGTITMMTLIGILVFRGSALIEKALAGWSFLLYAVYAVMIFSYLSRYGGRLSEVFAADDMTGNWQISAIKFISYNVTALPMILFCVRHLESRRDSIIAGAMTGPIGLIPAILFYLGMVASYPEILDTPVPAEYIMRELDFRWISILFYIVVFGTFVETGTALIHAINERIDHVFLEKSMHMPRWLRPVVAILLVLVAIVMATYFGVIDLIAEGYGSMGWAFLVVFFIPLMTVGVYRVWSGRQAPTPPRHD